MKSRTPVLFTHFGDEGIRGSERVLLDLLKDIDKDRFAPFLWCNAQTMAAAARELGVPIQVNRMPILLGWDAPMFDVAGFRVLVREGQRLIQTLGARVVHANSGAPNQWLVPAARQTRTPLVAHLHAVYKFRERCTLLLHQGQVIVGCSEAVVRPFRADGIPERLIRVIHNGVDRVRLETGDATGLRQSLGISADEVVIAVVGALVPLKGVELLLRALGRLREKGISPRLLIVGDGPQRGALQDLSGQLGLSSHMHFLGQRDDVGPILRDAVDIVAIPSRIESFGLVAVEAGLFGRPVVAAHVGGLEEVVEHEGSGLLVPLNEAAFAEALERLATDQALRRRLGERARSRVLTAFTTERAARSFERLYNDLLSRPEREFGWTKGGFRLAPFARLGFGVVGRRLGMRIADA